MWVSVKSGYKSFPYLFHFDPLPVAGYLIAPEVEFIELGEVFDVPPDKTVKPGVRFIEDTDSDTVGTVTPVLYPELETSFRINIPFINPVAV